MDSMPNTFMQLLYFLVLYFYSSVDWLDLIKTFVITLMNISKLKDRGINTPKLLSSLPLIFCLDFHWPTLTVSQKVWDPVDVIFRSQHLGQGGKEEEQI